MAPGSGSDPNQGFVDPDVSYWVRWHAPYEDPASGLSVRLRHVQDGVAEAIRERPPGPISVISLCAGQGRDVIDVMASHERAGDVPSWSSRTPSWLRSPATGRPRRQ